MAKPRKGAKVIKRLELYKKQGVGSRHRKTWKAIKAGKKDPVWSLYNLETDISETTDLSGQQKDILNAMLQFAADSQTVPIRKSCRGKSRFVKFWAAAIASRSAALGR